MYKIGKGRKIKIIDSKLIAKFIDLCKLFMKTSRKQEFFIAILIMLADDLL